MPADPEASDTPGRSARAVRLATARRRVAPSGPPVSLLSDDDLYLFNEGSHLRLWEHLGAHALTASDGTVGVYFAVWAPDARRVSVVGNFNGWRDDANPLAPRGTSGIGACPMS